MGFVNEDLIVKRRTDLEEARLKHFGWMCVLLSQRDRFYLEVFCVYRPPASAKEPDLCLKQNIEKA